jgi:hypothetical protein
LSKFDLNQFNVNRPVDYYYDEEDDYSYEDNQYWEEQQEDNYEIDVITSIDTSKVDNSDMSESTSSYNVHAKPYVPKHTSYVTYFIDLNGAQVEVNPLTLPKDTPYYTLSYIVPNSTDKYPYPIDNSYNTSSHQGGRVFLPDLDSCDSDEN